jgi:hypothetical protein
MRDDYSLTWLRPVPVRLNLLLNLLLWLCVLLARTGICRELTSLSVGSTAAFFLRWGPRCMSSDTSLMLVRICLKIV